MTQAIDWSTKTLEQRADHVGSVVDTRTDTVIRIGECLDLAWSSHGTGYEGHVSSIVGPTRHGKTTGFLVWASRTAAAVGGQLVSVKTKGSRSVESIDYVAVMDGYQQKRPVLCIGVAPSPTYRGLLKDTIHAIARTVPKGNPNHAELVDLLRRQIVEQDIRMLVFDEAHRISRPGSTTANEKSADVFSTLAKQTKVEIVLIGREGLVDLFEDNDELAEMKEQEFEIEPMPYPLAVTDPFCRFVRNFEKNMPFNEKSDLGGLLGAQLIHHWTDGAPGSTALLLSLVTKYAVTKNLPCVSLAAIGNALAKHKNVKKNKNIFLTRPTAEVMRIWAAVATEKARLADAENGEPALA